MSLLTSIFGRPKMTYRGVATQPKRCCDGRVLMPRWRGPKAMENETPMGFVCHACGREYLPYEVDSERKLRRRG